MENRLGVKFFLKDGLKMQKRNVFLSMICGCALIANTVSAGGVFFIVKAVAVCGAVNVVGGVAEEYGYKKEVEKVREIYKKFAIKARKFGHKCGKGLKESKGGLLFAEVTDSCKKFVKKIGKKIKSGKVEHCNKKFLKNLQKQDKKFEQVTSDLKTKKVEDKNQKKVKKDLQ